MSFEQTEIDAATYRRLRPREYLNRFLGNDLRMDGRRLDEFRSTSINQGSIDTANGSAVVRLGNTTMIAGVKLKTALPDPNREAGYVVPNIDLNPISNSKYKPGPPSEEAQVLSSRINDVLLSSGVLNQKDLTIEQGKAVWVVYIDVVCINFDGNAFDAALIAIVAALRNTRLPVTRYDFDNDRVLANPEESTSVPLTKTIIPTSFGLFDGKLVTDLNDFEQSLAHSRLTVVINEDGTLAHMSSQGRNMADNLDDSLDLTQRAIKIARERYDAIAKLII
ncbi:ribosomal protein S5 domain 2-like protein [Wallemia mellicola]|nr:ribosomal protein S5 domain 2-like protein [Wallemia mellicola]